METTTTISPIPKTQRWTGPALSGVAALMMLWSAGIKQVAPPGVPEHFAEMGWSMPFISRVGVLELACTLLYLLPRTRVLGAILLTAYLGGATAAHARLGDPVAFFPVVLGVMVWAGLFLRDPRLRAVLPLS